MKRKRLGIVDRVELVAVAVAVAVVGSLGGCFESGLGDYGEVLRGCRKWRFW